MATEKYALGTYTTLLTTALDGLASGYLALGSGFNNVAGGGGTDGYTLCDLELRVTFSSAPAAGTGVPVWFLAAPNGTDYEDGDASTTPARRADAVFPVRAVTTAQRIVLRVVLPQGLLKSLVKNDGTGAPFAASGNTLSIRPATYQGV